MAVNLTKFAFKLPARERAAAFAKRYADRPPLTSEQDALIREQMRQHEIDRLLDCAERHPEYAKYTARRRASVEAFYEALNN